MTIVFPSALAFSNISKLIPESGTIGSNPDLKIFNSSFFTNVAGKINWDILNPTHEIFSLSEITGVRVTTVCADYFMEAPLQSLSREMVKESKKVLLTLIQNSTQLGITDIVIPCVDQSSLIDSASKERFIENIQSSIELAEQFNINLSLETQ